MMNFPDSLRIYSKLLPKSLILSTIGGNFEFGNLQAIKDDYPKYVITMEDITGPLKEYPGINHIHLRDFLKLEF